MGTRPDNLRIFDENEFPLRRRSCGAGARVLALETTCRESRRARVLLILFWSPLGVAIVEVLAQALHSLAP